MEAMDDYLFGALNQNNDNMHKVLPRMREYALGILEARKYRIQLFR